MYFLILLIVALNSVIGQDGDYERYIDLLPEAEKQAFLEKVARRLIVSGIKTKDARYKSSEELSEEELNRHKAFVRQILAEESDNLRRNIKKNVIADANLKAKDKTIASAVDDTKYVDLTLREGKNRKKRNEEQKIDSDIFNVIPVKNVFEGYDNTEKPNQISLRNGTNELAGKDNNDENENTTGEDIQVRGPKKVSKVHDSLNVQRNVLSNEGTKVADFDPKLLTKSNITVFDGKIKRKAYFSSEESDGNTPKAFTAPIYVEDEKVSSDEAASTETSSNKPGNHTLHDFKDGTTAVTNYEASGLIENITHTNYTPGDETSVKTETNAADVNETTTPASIENDDKINPDKIETSTTDTSSNHDGNGNKATSNSDVTNDTTTTEAPHNITESTSVVNSTTNVDVTEMDPNNSLEKINDEDFRANYDSENYDENYRKNSSRKNSDAHDNIDTMQYFRSEVVSSKELNSSYSSINNDIFNNNSTLRETVATDNKEILGNNQTTDVEANTLEKDNKIKETTASNNKPSETDKDEQLRSDKKNDFEEGESILKHVTTNNDKETLATTEKDNNYNANNNSQDYTTDNITSKTYVRTDNNKITKDFGTLQNDKESLATTESYKNETTNENIQHYTTDTVTSNIDLETDSSESQSSTESVPIRSSNLDLDKQQETSENQTEPNVKDDSQDYDYLTRRNITENEKNNYSESNYKEKHKTNDNNLKNTNNTKLEDKIQNNYYNNTHYQVSSVLKSDSSNANLKFKSVNRTDDETVLNTNHLKVSSVSQNNANKNNKTDNLLNVFEELVNTTFGLKDVSPNTDELLKGELNNHTNYDPSSIKIDETKGSLRAVVARSHTVEPVHTPLTTVPPFYQIFYWRNVSQDLRTNNLKELKNVTFTHIERHGMNATKINDNKSTETKSDEMEFVSQSVNLEKIQHTINNEANTNVERKSDAVENKQHVINYEANPNVEGLLGNAENSNPVEKKKVKEYLVYEVPEGQSPFVVKDKPKHIEEYEINQEQPYYVPIYNYAPENAYYNARNRLGRNEDDDKSNDEDSTEDVVFSPSKKHYTRENTDQEFVNNNKDYRKFKFSVNNRPDSNRPHYYQNVHRKKPTIKLPLPIVFKKPKKTEIFLNEDDYFDMEYMKRKGKAVNRAHYDDYEEPLQLDGVYKSLLNHEAKSHLMAVRQMMYRGHYFGYASPTSSPEPESAKHLRSPTGKLEPNLEPSLKIFDQNLSRLRAHNTSGVVLVNGSHNSRNNDDISVDYYFGVSERGDNYANLRSKENVTDEYNKTINFSVTIGDAKRSLQNYGNRELFFKLRSIGGPHDLIGRADTDEEKGKSDENEKKDTEGKGKSNEDLPSLPSFPSGDQHKGGHGNEDKGGHGNEDKGAHDNENKDTDSQKKEEDPVPMTIRDIVLLDHPAEAFRNIERLKKLNMSYMRVRNDDVFVYSNVLSDMVELDNKALKQYDWLGSTVDILSALHKLKKLTNLLIKDRYVHPADKQLLKYVLHLYKLAKSSKETVNLNGLRKDKKKKNNALPRNTNRPKEYLKAKGLLDRVWLYIRARLIANKKENMKELKDFLKFLDDLEESLFDLHNAIKHIAMVTKFTKQKWYENLKQLYVRCKERKHILELLIHLFTTRFLELVEESALNGLEDGFSKYVEKNSKKVTKSVDELVFILKILEHFRSNHFDYNLVN